MTIKDISYFLNTMDTFVNPENKPLEELKIKYLSSSNSYHEELIPALDQRWCNMDYLFTLYMPPPSKNANGEFIMGAKEDWIERMSLFIDDLNLLLQLEYHRFWSEVAFNNKSLDGLSSFLQHAPPFYLRDRIPQDKDIFKIFKKALEAAFLLLIRLTRTKESEMAWMKSSTLGSILYNNFVISMPQLMEVCLIYANDNFKEVAELINQVINIQPKYISDIEKSIPFISEVFSSVENQICSAADVYGLPSLIASQPEQISYIEIVKLIYLMLDIGYSLATFLEVCPRAASLFHEHQLEPRIANFYGNTIPVINRQLDLQFKNKDSSENYMSYQLKLDLSRHQLISAVHGCLTTHLSSILEERDCLSDQELKNRVDNYLNTLSECICDHVFARDYNSAFPVQKELKILSEICPQIDSLKCDFIVESVLSLYDLPPKPQKKAKLASEISEAPSSSCSTDNHATQQSGSERPKKKITGVELESLVTEVKDILPHLGDGFVAKCLEHFNFVSADVINAILENTLPDSLTALDMDMPIIPEEAQESNGIPERINVYDNDEFDIMTQDQIDTTRIHKGKRQEKHKNLFEMLDDKTHVNQLRDLYTQLSLVECVENANEYDDEYDDAYDDVDVPVGNEAETEAEERRTFVTPRVLLQQQQKKLADEAPDCRDQEEEERESSGPRPDLFIENPADVRARAEQRRLEMRGRGSRSRAAFPHRDVVGKAKGQGQEKEVIQNRESKNTNKSSRGNHNRRSMAAKKRRQGLFAT